MKKFLVLLFMTSLVSAIEADFDCPKTVIADEEFLCYLVVRNIEGVYDVKVEIEKDGETLAKIFDPKEEKWQSAYYYIKEFVKEGEKKEVVLKIEQEGKFNGILKLRKGNVREFFDFEIEAIKGRGEKENLKENLKEEIIAENIFKEEIQEVKAIQLNNFQKENETKTDLIYESKNNKTIKFLPYVFSLLLIFIIGVLLWDKF